MIFFHAGRSQKSQGLRKVMDFTKHAVVNVAFPGELRTAVGGDKAREIVNCTAHDSLFAIHSCVCCVSHNLSR